MKKTLSTLFLLIIFCTSITKAQSGFYENGFIDDFSNPEPISDSSGHSLHWWGKEKMMDATEILLSRKDTGMLVNLTLPYGDYTPFGVSFWDNSEDKPFTMDFSGTSKIKMVLANNSPYSIKVKLGFIDTNDVMAEHYNSLGSSGEPILAWEHEIFSIIEPGEKKEIIKDLSGAYGFDYSINQMLYPDLSAIKTVYLICNNAELDAEGSYQPFPINNANMFLESFEVGPLPDDEKDSVISHVDIVNDSSFVEQPEEPVDTTVTPLPDSVPVVFSPGTNGYGFYYVPQITDMTWWGFDTPEGSMSTIQEDSSKLEVGLHKMKGSYDPIGLSFGLDSSGNPKTIDLRYAAELEIAMANTSEDQPYKVWFQLMDSDGKTASYFSEVMEYNDFWSYESAYILMAGEELTLKMDLTGLKGYDFMNMTAEDIDLSSIQSFLINLVNPQLDADDSYLPYAIDTASFEVEYVKVGRLELDSHLQSNLTNEESYSNLLEIFGCTDPGADNFDPEANKDNGSCFYSSAPQTLAGCIDPEALNFNEYAIENNGSCIYEQNLVADLPLLVKAGIERRDIIIAETPIYTCEIDFSKIIDSVNISRIIETDSLPGYALIEWSVYQRNNAIILYSKINKENIENGKVIKQKVQCSGAGERVKGVKEITLASEVKESQIILSTSPLVSSARKVTFYPNPVSDYLTLISDAKIEIHTVDGQLLHEATVQAGQRIYAGNWATGMYLITVTSNEGNYTSTFFKH